VGTKITEKIDLTGRAGKSNVFNRIFAEQPITVTLIEGAGNEVHQENGSNSITDYLKKTWFNDRWQFSARRFFSHSGHLVLPSGQL